MIRARQVRHETFRVLSEAEENGLKGQLKRAAQKELRGEAQMAPQGYEKLMFGIFERKTCSFTEWKQGCDRVEAQGSDDEVFHFPHPSVVPRIQHTVSWRQIRDLWADMAKNDQNEVSIPTFLHTVALISDEELQKVKAQEKKEAAKKTAKAKAAEEKARREEQRKASGVPCTNNWNALRSTPTPMSRLRRTARRTSTRCARRTREDSSRSTCCTARKS